MSLTVQARKFLSSVLLSSLMFLSFSPSALAAGSTLSPDFLEGKDALKAEQTLTSEVNWYKNLGQAKAAARQQNKMIMWILMLGKMDGAT